MSNQFLLQFIGKLFIKTDNEITLWNMFFLKEVLFQHLVFYIFIYYLFYH